MTSLKKTGIILLSLGLVLALAVTTACQKKADEKAAAASAQKPANEFEGLAKTGLGKFLYLDKAQGFDIVLEGFDAATLVGKELRVKGELVPAMPSIFRAESVEVKDGAGAYRNVYTRTKDMTLPEYLGTSARENYAVLAVTSALKPEEWEGKGKAKVFGKLQDTTVKEGGADKPITYILLVDDKGKDVGKIIVDSVSDYAKYYMKKLALYDKFWFYLEVKDSVDKKVRTKTKELFHADVQLAGLF
jgi:hypothetical protein